jgi:O-antigen/teichoic acid export membrane protein
MKLRIQKKRNELTQHLNDPLYKNAYFLMLSSVTSAGAGFFFWLIVARFYSTEEVGLASAIIAAMGLISMFSLLGFDISLVRFLPEREDKNELINSCLTISFIFSLALILIFIAGISIWSPSLSIIRENKFLLLLFVLFTAAASLTNLQIGGVFVGFRKTEYVFVQNIAILVRIVIVPFLVAFGAFGIYVSYGLTPILAFVLGIFLISKVYPSYKPVPVIKKGVVRDIFHFSLGNYLAKICEELPFFILPIMVINLLGAEKTAYFFIAWQISFLLLSVPRFTSASLLAEGSFSPTELNKTTKRAMKLIFTLLLLTLIGIFLFGNYLLGLFGGEYAKNSFGLLLILCIASLPYAVNAIYATLKRVQKETKPVIYVYGCTAIITLMGSYLLMLSMGLIGVGIAWVAGNGIVSGCIGVDLMRKRLFVKS